MMSHATFQATSENVEQRDERVNSRVSRRRQASSLLMAFSREHLCGKKR